MSRVIWTAVVVLWFAVGICGLSPNDDWAVGGNLTVLGNTILSGQMQNIAGTAAAPAYSFTGDLNSGVYRDAPDTVRVSTGGVQRLSITNTGATFSKALTVEEGLVLPASQVITFTGNAQLQGLNTGVWMKGYPLQVGNFDALGHGGSVMFLTDAGVPRWRAGILAVDNATQFVISDDYSGAGSYTPVKIDVATPTNTLNVKSTGAVLLGTSTDDASSRLQVSGDVSLTTIGNVLRIAGGTNGSRGRAVLVGGTVTVSNTLVTDDSDIFLTSQIDGGTPGSLRVSTRNSGTDFTIQSSSALDTSTVAWWFVKPSI